MLNNKKKANTRFFNSRHFPFILFGANTYFGNSKKRNFLLFFLSLFYFFLCLHVLLNRLLLDSVGSVHIMEKSYRITNSSMCLLFLYIKRFVQIFHRHGDRTPLNNYFSGSDLEKQEVETWRELVGIIQCI